MTDKSKLNGSGNLLAEAMRTALQESTENVQKTEDKTNASRLAKNTWSTNIQEGNMMKLTEEKIQEKIKERVPVTQEEFARQRESYVLSSMRGKSKFSDSDIKEMLNGRKAISR